METKINIQEIEPAKIKTIIESILFSNERPVELSELSQVLTIDKKTAEIYCEELLNDYSQQSCGIVIVKIAGGYQMCSHPDNESWLKKMYQQRGKQKLSAAALETLAIIAYKQPITRMEIESIRGVAADAVVKNLLEYGLIVTEGRKEVPGRPFLHVTTKKFLEYFGMNALSDLPPLEDFAQLAQQEGLLDENAPQETPLTTSEAIIETTTETTQKTVQESEVSTNIENINPSTN
jgi:segregation and condensation protein B